MFFIKPNKTISIRQTKRIAIQRKYVFSWQGFSFAKREVLGVRIPHLVPFPLLFSKKNFDGKWDSRDSVNYWKGQIMPSFDDFQVIFFDYTVQFLFF